MNRLTKLPGVRWVLALGTLTRVFRRLIRVFLDAEAAMRRLTSAFDRLSADLARRLPPEEVRTWVEPSEHQRPLHPMHPPPIHPMCRSSLGEREGSHTKPAGACHYCNGSGRDADGHQCSMCSGTGRTYVYVGFDPASGPDHTVSWSTSPLYQRCLIYQQGLALENWTWQRAGGRPPHGKRCACKIPAGSFFHEARRMAASDDSLELWLYSNDVGWNGEIVQEDEPDAD